MMDGEDRPLEVYEIPIAGPDLTPDEAKTMLDKVYNVVAVDPSHGYANSHHPLHRKWVDAMAALHAVWAKREGAGVSHITRACEEALAGKAVKDEAARKVFRAEAQKELDALEKLGFERVELPDDIQPWQLETWRMQRAHAEDNYGILTPMLVKALKNLAQPADITSLFETFSNAENIDADLRRAISEQLIAWVHAQNKARQARGKQMSR